jgi:RimJ/RimL family protein N-acetyltransferase
VIYNNDGNVISLSETNIRHNQVFSLNSLKRDDLELVRNWRNNQRASFINQDIISPESQINWFESLDSKSRYFISSVDNQKYGLFFLKNINLNDYSAEHGAFIGEPEYLSGPYSYASSYLINSFVFSMKNLKCLRITVIDNNKSAIKYNESLGYKEQYRIDGIIHYTLDSDSWGKNKPRIRKIVFGF